MMSFNPTDVDVPNFERRRLCTSILRLVIGAFGLLLACTSVAADDQSTYVIPYFSAVASGGDIEGIARIINHSAATAEVTIQTYDEDGRSYESLVLTIEPKKTIHLTSMDIEEGNPDKSLTGSTGPGRGPWRLALTSTADIEVLTYARSDDGFLASMHDVVASGEDSRELTTFRPASDSSAHSEVRLVNLGNSASTVSIVGVDDAGSSPTTGASISIAAGESLGFTSAELEEGDASKFNGSLGDGSGWWRLLIDADASVVVMNLHRSDGGWLTNLSTASIEKRHGVFRVPLLSATDASNEVREFVRIRNEEASSAKVSIYAFDDAGNSFDSLVLELQAEETKHISVADLENGNDELGLTGNTGPGEGNWRLDVSSDSDVSVSAYAQDDSGLLAPLHDVAPSSGKRHRVVMFNTADTVGIQSVLRLINPNDAAAHVRMTGFDEHGRSVGSEIRLAIPPQGAKEISARLLEEGSSDFEGALGYRASARASTWRLTITADQHILAMSLITHADAFAGNVSTAPQRTAGPVESASEAFETQISPIVTSKCSVCHVERGFAQNTRLVFETGGNVNDYNQNVFENFVFSVVDGMDRILTKIRGGDRHGGGVQVGADTPEWSQMQQFLSHLRNEKREIEGRAWFDANETMPIAHANCHFHEMRTNALDLGDSLTDAVTDDDGRFRMRAPSRTRGFLTCAPEDLPQVRLSSFIDTSVSESSNELTVSPRSTVVTLVLAMDLLRDPALDPSSYAASLDSSFKDHANFELLSDAAAVLFEALRTAEADIAFEKLLIDAYGNGQIDDPSLDAALVDLLNQAIASLRTERARAKLTRAATHILADHPLLAASQGIDDPVLPPPWSSDADDLEQLANNAISLEYARNPASFYMNAHWAHARGYSGSGETIGMVDTGLFAAHEEFDDRLHGETVFTVISDDDNSDGFPEYSYYKVRDADPKETYPETQPESDESCVGIYCKFYYYFHGTYMASIAVGVRNSVNAMGLAYASKIYFEPFHQQGTLRGFFFYHPPGDIERPWLISRHQIVRDVGDVASVVSNSWLTGTSSFYREGPASRYPFHRVLTPRYVQYQRHRPARDQSLILWAAGNRPVSAGPIVDGAAVPSLSERQIRALSNGEHGLADLLLTPDEREGLSAAVALQRAQLLQDALKRRWLTVVAVNDDQWSGSNYHKHVNCIAEKRTDADDCVVDWTMWQSSRCGFASDWCVAAGPSAGGVYLNHKIPPPSIGRYVMTTVQTSEATALVAGAMGLLIEAYRDEEGLLAVGTNAVLKRLKATARNDFFNPESKQSSDQRNSLIREEEMIRSLILYAGASDDDLRELMRVTRLELNAEAEGSSYEAPESRFDVERVDRYRIFNRFVNYGTSVQTGEIAKLLNQAHEDEARARDLLAQLIRQIEWIDTQLLRLGKSKEEITDEGVRKIALTSLVGHGIVDLKAATDPER